MAELNQEIPQVTSGYMITDTDTGPEPMTLFEKVRLAREGSAVERCHTAPHRERYSVGHHSLDLVTLITLCWAADHSGKLPRAELLVAAAFHDIPERITGDMPQPVKELCGSRLDAADSNVFRALGVPDGYSLSAEEQAYLHYGDRLELYLWCVDQFRQGDPSFLPWCNGYDEAWEGKTLPPSYQAILKAVKDSGRYYHRLDFKRLKEIAGL